MMFYFTRADDVRAPIPQRREVLVNDMQAAFGGNIGKPDGLFFAIRININHISIAKRIESR